MKYYFFKNVFRIFSVYFCLPESHYHCCLLHIFQYLLVEPLLWSGIGKNKRDVTGTPGSQMKTFPLSVASSWVDFFSSMYQSEMSGGGLTTKFTPSVWSRFSQENKGSAVVTLVVSYPLHYADIKSNLASNSLWFPEYYSLSCLEHSLFKWRNLTVFYPCAKNAKFKPIF